MKRFHIFEFEDYSWFPKFIRDGGTDFLGFILKRLKYYQPAVSLLEDSILKTQHKAIIDMCSGSGSPIDFFSQNTSLDLTYTLTDKFPNNAAHKLLHEESKGLINFHPEALNVLDNTADLKGFYTMFTAIHHFKPSEVKTILEHNVKQNMPIAFFDGGDKHIGSILAILITHPILFFIGTPFIKPFKLSRIAFTYIIPLIPLYAVWDGMISILRLHKPETLLSLAKEADTNNTFEWQSGKKKNWLGFSVSYLIGLPKQIKPERLL